MVRVFGFLIGLGFAGVLLISLISGVMTYFAEPPEELVSERFHLHAKHAGLPSDGMFGKFDNQQVQRGFQVYQEVCAACHGLKGVAFRDLEQIGYNEAEVKKIASDWKIQVPAINESTGEVSARKAVASDRFPEPFANEIAARAANNNAYPPDLTLITKAREGGSDYIYSLLVGYRDAKTFRNEKGEAVPAEVQPGQGLYFNPYFHNLNIAMPPPLTADGQVTYAEGNPKPTIDQMAKDVSAFLVWTAQPELGRRHAAGIAVVIFLLVASLLGYLAYTQIWAEAKRKVAPVGPLDPVNKAKRESAKAKAAMKN
jgi:ubiquinol-cytochrome c reductase cytochrome c1 subunit